MKILFLASDVFGSNGGMAEFNKNLVAASLQHPKIEKIGIFTRLGNATHEIAPEGVLEFNQKGVGKLLYMIRTLLIAKTFKPDIIVCGLVTLVPAAWLAKMVSGSKLTLVIHGIDAWTNPFGKWFIKIVGKIDQVASVSEITKKRYGLWSQTPQDRISIIPNTIDLNKFTPGKKPEYLLDRHQLRNKLVILTLGRLSRPSGYKKGHSTVLKALAMAPPSLLSNITYIIAGEGEDKSKIEDEVKKLKLEKQVIFAGSIREDEKVDYYRLADVFAMPGEGEGFGIVFLEAMACGVPVIGSKLDGSVDALKNGELGLLVNPKSLPEVIEAIQLGLTQQKSVPEGIQYFSFQKFESRVNRLYDTLLDA